jgi:hypothetical protein
MTCPTSLPFFTRPERRPTRNGSPTLRRKEAFILPSYDEALLNQEVAKKKAFPPSPSKALTPTNGNVQKVNLERNREEEAGHDVA